MKKFECTVKRYRFIVECKEETNGIFSCYIPAYDMYFGAKDEEMIEKKSKAMVGLFFESFDKK